MTRLNLPPFEIKLRGTKAQPQIFDILRKNILRSLQKNGCGSISSTSWWNTRVTLQHSWQMKSN